MTIRLLPAIILIVSLFAHSLPALADFNSGAAAYSRGDYATALEEWRPLAEAGNLAAQFNLGLMHYNGKGVSQNFAEAAIWFGLAAEQGDAAAQINLGVMAYNGEGIEQDFAQAHFWFTLAARLFPAGPERDQASKNLAIAGGNLSAELIAENERKAEEWRLRFAAAPPPPPGAPRLTDPQQVARAPALVKTEVDMAAAKPEPVGGGDAPAAEIAAAVAAAVAVEPAAGPAGEAEAPATEPAVPQVAEAAAPAPTPEAQPPEAAQVAAVASAKGFAIQLGSLKSTDAAAAEITRLQAQYEDLLQEVELTVQRADIEGRGTFYRIYTARFASKGAADEICGQLKARNQDCLVVQR